MVSDEKALAERAPIAFGSQGLELRTIDDMYRFAVAVVKSGLAPRGYDKPEQVMVAVQAGAELGFGPMQSLQSLAVVNGRPTLMVEPALALVLRSGLLAANDHSWDLDGDDRFCAVEMRRKGGLRVCRTFSMRDARRAGLLNKKGPWTDYPDRMLYNRAMGFALRDLFPDLLRGVGIHEEQTDIRVERNVTPPKPKRAALPADPAVKAIFELAKPVQPVESGAPPSSEVPPSSNVSVDAKSASGAPDSDPVELLIEPAPEAPAQLRAAIWNRAQQTPNPAQAATLIEMLVRERFGGGSGSLDGLEGVPLQRAVALALNCRVDLKSGEARA